MEDDGQTASEAASLTPTKGAQNLSAFAASPTASNVFPSTTGGAAVLSMPDATSNNLGMLDLASVTGASILASTTMAATLDNGRRDSFGSIVAGLSAPFVSPRATSEPQLEMPNNEEGIVANPFQVSPGR